MDTKLYIFTADREEKAFKLEPEKTYSLGRSKDNYIVIKDKNVSRYHLKFQIESNKLFIMDLNSKNGTFANGKDIPPGIKTEVQEGVPIVIGMTVLGFGEVSESCLKPLLKSAGIYRETTYDERAITPKRGNEIKKNLECIYKVEKAFSRSTNIDEMLKKVSESILDLLIRIDKCLVILLDEKTGEISSVIGKSRKPDDSLGKDYNKDLVKKVLMLNKPVMVADTYDKEFEDDDLTESLQIMEIGSAMCVPISSFSQTKGAIYVDSTERPYGFRKNDLHLLSDIGSRTALALDEKILSETIGNNNDL